MAMDLFAKITLGCLLFFLPFAFAGAEPWAFSVLQGGLVLCWGLVLASRRKLVVSPLFIPVLFTLGFLILFTLLQTCFPKTLLDKAVYYPVSLMPLYGWEHASLFITYLAVVALVPQLYSSQAQGEKLLIQIIVSVVAVALCAASLPKGEYIFQLAGVRGGVGSFLNRNHAAVFFALGAVVTLGVFFTRQLHSRAGYVARQRYAFYVQQSCLFLVFVGLCAGTVMTRSRGGILSLVVGLFCYAFLCAWAIPRALKRRLKGIFITLVAAVMVTGWVYTHVKQINAFSRRGTEESTQTRKMLYRSAGRLLKEYPVWGIGVGAMPVVITSYVERPLRSYIERLHNDWLEILLGIGYGGALFILGGLGWFIWRALKRMRELSTRKQILFAALLSALAAMSAGSGVDFHFFIPANAFLFFVLLGVVCAPTYAKERTDTVYLSSWLKLGLCVVLLAAVYVPGRKTLAWRYGVFGQGLKTSAKLVQYERALAVYPSVRNAVRLGNTYYNASLHTSGETEKSRLRGRAFERAVTYLRRYPREKSLSALYMRARPAVGQRDSDLVK